MVLVLGVIFWVLVLGVIFWVLVLGVESCSIRAVEDRTEKKVLNEMEWKLLLYGSCIGIAA